MKQKYLEHQTLGRRVVCAIDPATQLIILKIVGFKGDASSSMLLSEKIVQGAFDLVLTTVWC